MTVPPAEIVGLGAILFDGPVGFAGRLRRPGLPL